MEFKTNYPFVLVHGMLGFGKDEFMNLVCPYWGMLSGSLPAYLTDQGFEVYDPSVGKYSSAWDRACELYAQLMGGTVDYGVAHSEKYGHKRYGRTYEKPLFDGFGPEKKVNLVGHSFGGATIRLFATLMAYGSEEEKAATKDGQLSELFKGGKADWIYSITAVASVHEGTTLLSSARNVMDKLEDVTYVLANITGNNPLGRLYESHMEQWGLIDCDKPGNVVSRSFSKANQELIKTSHDNVWYDLTLKGASEVNATIKTLPNVYYFSWPCCRTTQRFCSLKPRQTPRFVMSPVFWPMSRSIGNYSHDPNFPKVDEHWLANDGVVPTISETAPFDEPHMDLHDLKGDPQPGIWYVYDPLPYDHLGVIGGFLPATPASQLQPLYRNHFRLINQLGK
ncbi:MAG: lipase [Clostridia bacterium]|nr:lipase [Clostridia bacterium]